MSDTEKIAVRGGEFLISGQNYENISLPEESNEEQKMMINVVSEFVKKMGDKANHLENQTQLLKEAAELGLLGAHIPEEYGGMSLRTDTITMILEEMGHAGGSFNTSYAAHTGIGMLPILYFGTEEQKKKYLPKLASGEEFASYCLTEPGSGSDALAAKTKAILSEDGKHYVLNGQKMWISNAGFADVLIVFAQVDGDKFTGFVVDAHSEGIKLGEEEHKMGIKGSSTRQVFFEDCEVPVENVLGEVGKGHLIAFNVLNIGRFKLGILSVGGSKALMNIALNYAQERKQFGQSIAEFGAIKYKLAEMAIRTFANESAVYRISQMLQNHKQQSLENGKSEEEALKKAAEEYSIECAIVKVTCSECLDYVADEAVQIHGGYGFSEEYEVATSYRDARINRIYEGTNEINRLLIVDMLLKKALKGKLDITGPAWEVQKELTKMPGFDTGSGEYYEEKTCIENLKKIALIVAGGAAKYQMDGKLNLESEQEIVMNVADILSNIFLAESLLLRVRKSEEKGLGLPIEVQKSIMRVFLYDSQEQIVKWSKDALVSFAKGQEKKVMITGLKRFTKYPIPNVVKERRIIADHYLNRD